MPTGERMFVSTLVKAQAAGILGADAERTGTVTDAVRVSGESEGWTADARRCALAVRNMSALAACDGSTTAR